MSVSDYLRFKTQIDICSGIILLIKFGYMNNIVLKINVKYQHLSYNEIVYRIS